MWPHNHHVPEKYIHYSQFTNISDIHNNIILSDQSTFDGYWIDLKINSLVYTGLFKLNVKNLIKKKKINSVHKTVNSVCIESKCTNMHYATYILISYINNSILLTMKKYWNMVFYIQTFKYHISTHMLCLSLIRDT